MPSGEVLPFNRITQIFGYRMDSSMVAGIVLDLKIYLASFMGLVDIGYEIVSESGRRLRVDGWSSGHGYDPFYLTVTNDPSKTAILTL